MTRPDIAIRNGALFGAATPISAAIIQDAYRAMRDGLLAEDTPLNRFSLTVLAMVSAGV